MINNYLSVNEVAKKLNYTVQHTRLLIRQGKIQADKIGRDWLVVNESVAKYQAENKNITSNDK